MTRKMLKAVAWIGGGLIVLCLLGLSILTVHDVRRFGRLQKRISGIAVGDTRDRVRQVMGEPDAGWDRQKEFMSNRELAPGLAYGRTMDWGNAFLSEFPFFYPFRIRLFGPDPDDIVVEFDDDWIVTGIRIPK
jgi:hypothetical protein